MHSFVFADHHPYSVDAEFEVVDQCRFVGCRWGDSKFSSTILNPELEHRQIARLVKAKEKENNNDMETGYSPKEWEDAHLQKPEPRRKLDVNRVYSLKDLDGPFYWDGQCFRSFDGLKIQNPNARCDGDYFSIPVFVKPKETESQDKLWMEVYGYQAMDSARQFIINEAKKRFRIERI